jgi:hypothetical protein
LEVFCDTEPDKALKSIVSDVTTPERDVIEFESVTIDPESTV